MQHKSRNYLKKIIQKYLRGTASKDEEQFLDDYYHFFDREDNIVETMDAGSVQKLSAEMFAHVKQKKQNSSYSIPFYKNKIAWAAAAILLLVFTTGIYMYTKKNLNNTATTLALDANPATNKASLRLADGSIVLLDTLSNGMLTSQGDVGIYAANGRLVYQGTATENLSNIITTPRGGQYQVTLADGTKVWLNAESSLAYPVAFNGKERSVQLTGEAYFEVAPNIEKPFLVIINNKEQVEVLGTHFNINAYPDDLLQKTTLLEGKIKIKMLPTQTTAPNQEMYLTPGQQAVVKESGMVLNTAPDIDQVMAWRRGKFYFENAKLETILKEFSRWYDVDVIYEGNESMKDKQFFMIVNRDVPLSEVLKSLQSSNVRFEINAKRLIIK